MANDSKRAERRAADPKVAQRRNEHWNRQVREHQAQIDRDERTERQRAAQLRAQQLREAVSKIAKH